MLSIHGTFKNRKSVPTKLRLGNFNAPKHTPWDHVALDNWLPDYAARHLSNMTDKEFVVRTPMRASQERRYSGLEGGYVCLDSASPPNDPVASGDPPLQSPDGSHSGNVLVEGDATAHFLVSCPRCGNVKQAAGHWLYKPDRRMGRNDF